MQPISPEDLTKLVGLLDAADDEARDELLTDFLVAVYPSLVTQDN